MKIKCFCSIPYRFNIVYIKENYKLFLLLSTAPYGSYKAVFTNIKHHLKYLSYCILPERADINKNAAST